MTSLFGVVRPDRLRALIEVCFNTHADQNYYQLINHAIQTDTLSGEQYRVLPLLYCKADLNRFSEFTFSKIKGAYKHTLFRNHLLLHRANKFQKILTKEGFHDPIFLKGVSSCLRSRCGIGLRPMADVDLLVKDLHNEPEKIISLLKTNNFKIIETNPRSITTLSPDGFQFDLHWYLSEWALSAQLVQNIVNSAEKISFRNYSLFVPSIEHHFIHVLAHGVLNPVLSHDARWSIDVLMLLTENNYFCIERLVNFANQFSARSNLKKGLQIIAEETPETIKINRSFLLQAAKDIDADARIVHWLFSQSLHSSRAYSHRLTRLSWMKGALMNTLYVPLKLWLSNKVPLSRAIGLSQSFPPLSIAQSCQIIFRKFLQRVPQFLSNTLDAHRKTSE